MDGEQCYSLLLTSFDSWLNDVLMYKMCVAEYVIMNSACSCADNLW